MKYKQNILELSFLGCVISLTNAYLYMKTINDEVIPLRHSFNNFNASSENYNCTNTNSSTKKQCTSENGKCTNENNRIIGGAGTTIEKSPYVVSVRRNDKHVCGGIIINDFVILTAAHCLSKCCITNIRVGNVYHKKGKSYKVNRVIQHPRYIGHRNKRNNNNDIAILQLAKRIKFGPKVRAISIAPPLNYTGKRAIISGWGSPCENCTISDVLQSVDVDVLPIKKCKRVYGHKFLITNKMVCASSGGKDSCKGDSGGPLAIVGKGLLGIVSCGIGCGHPNYPGIYTKVSKYVDWIYEHLL